MAGSQREQRFPHLTLNVARRSVCHSIRRTLRGIAARKRVALRTSIPGRNKRISCRRRLTDVVGNAQSARTRHDRVDFAGPQFHRAKANPEQAVGSAKIEEKIGLTKSTGARARKRSQTPRFRLLSLSIFRPHAGVYEAKPR